MARIRTVKPEFWTDGFMVQLPHFARLLYIALWTCADDHGFIPDEPERIAMEVMPREDPLSVDDWIQFFTAAGRLEMFVGEDGSSYLRVGKWEAHQRVDHPAKSKIAREGSRKLAITPEVRREVARKYGCSPGEEVPASCFYCGQEGAVHWHRVGRTGAPSQWVTFPGLELDHFEPESEGGEGTEKNLVLACRGCNRRKGTKDWFDLLCSRSGVTFLASPREASCEERNRDQGKEQGREELPSPASRENTLTVSPPQAASPGKAKADKQDPITAATWEAYRAAYLRRHGAEPLRNAKVNGQLAQLLKRLPAENAPAVAAFYVSHNDALYVRAKHPTDLLLRDAEKLHTEWKTGRVSTRTEAEQQDRTTANVSGWLSMRKE